MDSATTKCWINLNLGPRREGTTLTSIAGSGAITTITFQNVAAVSGGTFLIVLTTGT